MDVVRLTVTHDGLEPDSEMFHRVSFGWPALMSGLKTLLESGKLGPAAVLGPGRGLSISDKPVSSASIPQGSRNPAALGKPIACTSG